MTDIIVPTLGESVSEATVGKWFKAVGDEVQKDELLVELETDKVTLEVNALASGVLKEIKAAEGDTVQVDQLLGILEEGSVSGKAAPKKEEKPAAPKAAAPAAKVETAAPVASAGAGGRTAKGDVQAFINRGTASTGSASAAPASAGGDEAAAPREERVKMSKLRQVIAKRLKDSQNTAAMLTTFNEVDMTNVMELRSQYKDQFEDQHKAKLGFMSFFTKAAVAALKELPAVNAEINGDDIIYKNYYDIGMAVGTPQGLVVPVVRDADKRSLAGIEAEIVRLAKRARDGKLGMDELTGGTFTITNGGVYGSMLSTPIINPPQSGILGLHNIVKRPVVMPDGSIQARPIMYIALSYDHRIIDGREAVTFLVRVKEKMEDPRRLLLEV